MHREQSAIAQLTLSGMSQPLLPPLAIQQSLQLPAPTPSTLVLVPKQQKRGRKKKEA
jgi:hypothetical protein